MPQPVNTILMVVRSIRVTRPAEAGSILEPARPTPGSAAGPISVVATSVAETQVAAEVTSVAVAISKVATRSTGGSPVNF